MKRDQETLSSAKTYRIGGVEFERQEDGIARGGGHVGKGPKGYRRSDKVIYEDVCEALTHDSELDASGIEVEVHDGVVTFKGLVSSRRMKRLAEEIAEEVPGVRDIQNQLKIDDTDKLRVYSGM